MLLLNAEDHNLDYFLLDFVYHESFSDFTSLNSIPHEQHKFTPRENLRHFVASSNQIQHLLQHLTEAKSLEIGESVDCGVFLKYISKIYFIQHRCIL